MGPATPSAELALHNCLNGPICTENGGCNDPTVCLGATGQVELDVAGSADARSVISLSGGMLLLASDDLRALPNSFWAMDAASGAVGRQAQGVARRNKPQRFIVCRRPTQR